MSRTANDFAAGPTRAQVVVSMAVVVTVALVPVAAAYLQLGYTSGDAAVDRGDGSDAVVRALASAVGGVESQVAGEYDWRERERAVDAVHGWLDPRVDGIETPGGAETTAITIRYNQSLAERAATTTCPSGRGRAFGACDSIRGVVVQERAGETVVVAVALDVRVVAADGTTRVSRMIRP